MVRMAEKLHFGVGMADWQERINVERLRAERAEKARAAMRQRGVPALLATRPMNTRYLTGLKGPEFQPQLWYVLFFAEHDPVVFHHAGWIHHYPAEVPWIKEWRLARASFGGCGPAVQADESALFADGIYRELAERGLAGEPLGVVGFDGLSQQALAAKGLQLADGWAIMLEATKTKTVDEIACLKMAFAVADGAWYRTLEALRPGAVDMAVSAIARQGALESGADEVPTMHLRSGAISFDRSYSGVGRVMSHGDLVYGAYCGVDYMGYQTCYYRTFCVGREPTVKERDWYKVLVERLDRVIDAIKPGNTTADAAQHFPPASKWGYQDEAELLTLEIGHGIGMYAYGYPIINRQWSLEHPQEFEVGMTIAIEGREGEPGHGGVRLEDAVVVTPDGCELIDHWPRAEILTAPLR